MNSRLFSGAFRVAVYSALATFAVQAFAQSPSATPSPAPLREAETKEQRDARMAWWRDAKFGMFVHWGVYSIPADGEWHMRNKKVPMAEYRKFADEFNPTKFNADEWGALAQTAGMKYLVLTTKHHDGFAMFHSKASDYNIYDATPFKRDPLKELSEALPKYGVKLGTYYSVIADWGHPGGGAGCPKWDPAQEGSMDEYIDKVSIPQVRELLTNYGPIAIMWFDSDGAQAQTPDQVARYAPVMKLQPDIIIDPRLRGFPGDFETCEGKIPMQAPKGDWELCTRTNSNWGYTGAAARPLKVLLDELTEAWGKGGNVLLNVGPTREGQIPADSVQRLNEIGAWLKVNGEAIYSSVRGPFDYLPWGWTTWKDGKLYALVQKWPTDGKLKLPMTVPVAKAWMLSDPDTSIPAALADGITTLTVPSKASDPNVNVVAIQVSGTIPVYRAINLNTPVTASDNPRGAANTVNGGAGGDWRIPAQEGWIAQDLGEPRTFSVLRVTTPYTTVKKLTLEVKSGDEWKPVLTLENPKGTDRVETFAPVTAQEVRVSLTGDKPGIRIGVFELFPPL